MPRKAATPGSGAPHRGAPGPRGVYCRQAKVWGEGPAAGARGGVRRRQGAGGAGHGQGAAPASSSNSAPASRGSDGGPAAGPGGAASLGPAEGCRPQSV